MQRTDVAIAGGGLAGSTAAAMLGRAGFDVALIDPHASYPPDFRCEKLDGSQVRVLEKTGLADAVLRAATPDRESWVARLGYLVDKRPGDQHGILYQTLVNTVREQIPDRVSLICAKVADLATSSERQTLKLSNGEEISARLIVLANGLNSGLRQRLGMVREDLSPCHSIMLGFDMRPVGRAHFDFPALTYYAETPADRAAYVTLFPIGSAMRANLSVYRGLHDPWLRQFRQTPEQTLFGLMPGLRRLTGDIEVSGFVHIRPADLYVTRDHLRPGIVLVGDAYATSCPAAGTGVGKVFTDVERLCNGHVPDWLAIGGMGADKMAAFYDDPVKRACDAHSLAKAYQLRSLSIEQSLPWRARRWGRFAARLGVGTLRQARRRLSTAAPRTDRPAPAKDVPLKA
jgi:2-polyprenyl-6-methoxyphenol hydroxylase-like FAD-dependent oxidoreductase